MRIAHISDLHFAKLSFNPLHFFSKRFLGTLNFLFFRHNLYLPQRLYDLIATFKEQAVTHVIISGDLSTTSFAGEFKKAQLLIEAFKQAGLQVFAIPGNHDNYTQESFKAKRFYRFFPKSFSKEFEFNLKDHGVTACGLGNNWWLIALDTSLAMPWISSEGLFSETLEKHLEALLQKIPKGGRVIMTNHFPLFQNESPRKALLRAGALQKLLLRHPEVELYLHGHTHRHCVADLRPSQLPIVLDSGSTAHRDTGSWNLIDLSDLIQVDVFRYKEGWSVDGRHALV